MMDSLDVSWSWFAPSLALVCCLCWVWGLQSLVSQLFPTSHYTLIIDIYALANTPIFTGSPSKKKGSTSDLPSSWAYVVELVCSGLYSLTFVTDLVVKGILHITGERIYGYTIVVDAVGTCAWLSSIFLIHRIKMEIIMNRHRSFTLVLFWMVGVVWVGLEAVSINGASWWWHLRSRVDISDLVLFLVRSLLLVALVTVGILRPLLCRGRRRGYSLLINSDGAAKEEDSSPGGQSADVRRKREGDFIRTKSTSAFANMWGKVKYLFPYIWPKGKSHVGVVSDICGCG